MPIQKYSLQIILRSTSGLQVVTEMTPQEVNSAIMLGNGPGHVEIKAVNEHDEAVVVQVLRDQIDGYILGPFHRADARRPGLLQ